MAFKTPGVYVKEISVFPPSVAEVATAIPAFIGHTEKAERKGEDLTNVPTRLRSLLEFHEFFGVGYEPTSINVAVDSTNNYAVESVTPAKRFYMYEALRLFFDNGGGGCYIVSVGGYDDTIQNGDEAADDSRGFRVGLKALEKYDEPTIILFPDAVLLSEVELYTLQQRALAQCARLQDRVAVFDLREFDPSTGALSLQDSVSDFRNSIGINNLKYGAAYTPWLYSAYPKAVPFDLFKDTVKDESETILDLATITSDSALNKLVTLAASAIDDQTTLSGRINALRGPDAPTLKDRYATLRNAVRGAADDGEAKAAFAALIGFARLVAVDIPVWTTVLTADSLLRDLDTYANDKLRTAVHSLIGLEKNARVGDLSDLESDDVNAQYGTDLYDPLGWLGEDVSDISGTDKVYAADGTGDRDTALAILEDLDPLFEGLDEFVADILEAADVHADLAQRTVYEGHTIIGNIVEHIKRNLARVPPSGAVAGVYAYVDSTRGVWKAPANVSLNTVLGPVTPLDFYDQEELNVDVNSGKSINAIRSFTGRGTVVWGARTLAGNDNEWRYVPVRRFFNMVEESVKKSTAWAVFEPNAAALWTRVKSMIDNYLIQKWREGALAGAIPDEAFFVKVGLGQTMTAQDILEGRLNVEIGMAVVRPAEFIILKFSHMMQKS